LTKDKHDSGRHYITGLGLQRRDANGHQVKGTGRPEDAIAALSRFDIVGVTERMDATIARMAIGLGCDPGGWHRHSEKRTIGRPSFNSAPQQIKALLTNITAPDMLVWQAATRLAEAAESALGPALSSSIARMQENNPDDCKFSPTAVEISGKGEKAKPDCLVSNHNPGRKLQVHQENNG
jgi:hypothetical protein